MNPRRIGGPGGYRRREDGMVGAGVTILAAGFALIARGVADSVTRLFGMR